MKFVKVKTIKDFDFAYYDEGDFVSNGRDVYIILNGKLKKLSDDTTKKIVSRETTK